MRRRARRGGGRQVQVKIEGLGGRGDGVGHVDGRPVYVPYVLPGEEALVRLVGERAGGFKAELLELLSESGERKEPPCPHFGPCGGCAVQHLAESAYPRWKQSLVEQALERVGLPAEIVRPIATVPRETRRRANLAATRRGGGASIGFHGRESHRVENIETCFVVTPAILALLPQLRGCLPALLDDRETADIVVTESETGLDVLLRSAREPGLEARQALADLAERADLARLSWAPPKGEAEPVAQRRRPEVHFAAVAVSPPPGAFLQPTVVGEHLLRDSVLEFLGGVSGTVGDLYAGCGTFTFPLAERARVMAVEGDEPALAALWEAARHNDLAGRIVPEPRDLARQPLSASELNELDAVVFDPPRVGAKEQAREIAASDLGTAIAVSCNPNTFARDARTLVDGGFRLVEVRPVDQFIWTGHVELVALFRRDRETG